MIKACIFDLDGVIVDTAKYHFIAWKRLAAEFGYELTEAQNEKLKGVSRMGSLELLLEWAGVKKTEEEKFEMTERKNIWYRALIKEMDSSEILEGVMPFLENLKENKISFALGSASKNSNTILEQVGLSDCFEAVVDGNKTTRSKPDPQTFELGAEALHLKSEECIVFEDSQKGIEAALRGGFYAVGIGEEEVLSKAHLVIPNFIGLTFENIVEKLS
ncbi:MAG: beta-phosphoglucomutase [Bacteroidetes bacterium]|jgi:beta-phosphoglucomutase|nr:beta-phosphoglucomutase [Bacteroidota bacterium]